jgi:hypothetical protein
MEEISPMRIKPRRLLTAAILATISQAVLPAVADDGLPATQAKHPSPAAKARGKELIGMKWGEELFRRSKLGPGKRDAIPGAEVEFDEETNLVGGVRPLDENEGIKVPPAATPREAIERFFREHHRLFGLSENLAELKLWREVPSGNTFSAHYRQVYNGLPVFGGAAGGAIHVGKSSIQVVTARIAQITKPLNIEPPTDPAPAIRAVRAEIESRAELEPHDRPELQPRATLGIVVRDGEPRPTWEVLLPTLEADWEAYVDAETNRVLSVANEMIYG